MMLFCRNFFVSIFENHVFFVFTPSKRLKLSDHVCMCTHCTVMKWFHYLSRVVRNLVLYSCSPMAVVTFYVLLLNC